MEFLESKFLGTIKKFGLIQGGDRIVVGFSGGVDSTVLLHLLNKFKGLLGIELLAVHVNHLIRETANRDENFCINFCMERGIEILVFRKDVREFSKVNKLSLEESGRIVRYSFFNKVLNERSFNKIATAHHLDDNIETFFFRLFKGTSLKGLSCIRPKVGNVVRPLIESTRSEIIDYSRSQGINFVIDETNYDLSFPRNYIRNIVIPSFEAKFPNFREKVSFLMEDIWSLEKFIRRISFRIFRKYVYFSEGSVYVDFAKLRMYNKFISKEVFKNVLRKVGVKISRKIIDTVFSSFDGKGNKKLIEFGDVEVIQEYNFVRVSKKNINTSQNLREFYVSGIKVVSEFDVDVWIDDIYVDSSFIRESKLSSTKGYMFISIGNPKQILIRHRRNGDFLEIGSGKKKVKDILIDDKVPSRIRNNIAIVDIDGEVAGIFYGKIRVSSKFLLSEGNRKVLKIKFRGVP
ncbi:MAG: tRNA lysidine(34) synthetase TilS [Brevinematia bacterium]